MNTNYSRRLRMMDEEKVDVREVIAFTRSNEIYQDLWPGRREDSKKPMHPPDEPLVQASLPHHNLEGLSVSNLFQASTTCGKT